MGHALLARRDLQSLSGGDGRKRQTKKSCLPNRGPGLVASLLYSTLWRQARYVRICWCGVVSLRGDPPSRTASFPYVCGYVVRQGYRDAVTVPLSEMWGGRQPGSRQVRESLPKLAGGVPAGQGNRKRKRGGPWQALPLFLVYGRALTGPERLPAFPGPGRLQPEQRPQGPGPLQQLPHQQRAFPVRPFR